MNKVIQSLVSTSDLAAIAEEWISGNSYAIILQYCIDNSIKKYHRLKEVELELSDVISICDEGFGYSAILIFNAIYEFCKTHEENDDVCNLINDLTKSLRYGLPSSRTIRIYENGFSDRVIAQLIDEVLEGQSIKNKKQLFTAIKNNRERINNVLVTYPSLYRDLAQSL